MRDLEVQGGFVKSDQSSGGQSEVSSFLFFMIHFRETFTYPHELTRLLQKPSQYSKSFTFVYRTLIYFHFPSSVKIFY
jgi:hypothetical protein